MATGHEKVAQYLGEAHATEQALVRTLQAHIGVTPEGEYRKLLERHLGETRQHADRVSKRLAEVGERRDPARAGADLLETIAGQVAALGKVPLDLLRGTSAEEKLVKNAKDECASEALEIATYDALEALARAVGDDATAELAVRNRADEERMLADLRKLLPRLTQATVTADVDDAASSRDGGRPPWAGYDSQSATAINKRLARANKATARRVLEYERAHKNRKTLVAAAQRRAS